jgi:hypothetical protein
LPHEHEEENMNSHLAPRTSVLVLTVLLALAIANEAATTRAVAAPGGAPVVAPPDTARIARGGYLVRIMGCNDCHTPWTMGPDGPGPDMSRQLSGHPEGMVMPPAPAASDAWVWSGAGTNTAFAGPWGVSFTANLTPDEETGLGRWTESTFIQALRTGRHEGQGRPILPPMPWPMYRQATDEDLGAIFAYLQSIPPIRNKVPQPIDPPEAP